MALPKVSLNDGKHKLIVAEEGERVLTPEQNKEYEMQHPHARREPMRADVYEEGGVVEAPDPLEIARQNPRSDGPNLVEGTTPTPTYTGPTGSAPKRRPMIPVNNDFEMLPSTLYNQETFDKGGEVKAEPSIAEKISNRATELYHQAKALVAPEDTEAASMRNNKENINQYKAATEPKAEMSQGSPEVHGTVPYGSRSGEMRLRFDPQGNEINPTTPAGMRVRSQGVPEPAALRSAPVYDDGGVVTGKEDDPDKVAAYKQAEAEVLKEENVKHLLPEKKVEEPQLDTEPASPTEKPTVRMNTDNAPMKGPDMNTGNAPGLGPIPTEASTRPKLAAPLPTTMKVRPQTPEAAPEIAPPDPMDIVQQDKLAAMKQGPAGLTNLGTARIHERVLGGGPELVAPTPEMPKPVGRENPERAFVLEKEKDLRYTMLHGDTELARAQAEKELADLHGRTPLGSKGSAMPGLGGKILHGLSAVAQGIGQGVAPYAVNAIPGSRADIARKEAIGEQGVEAAQKHELTAADIEAKEAAPELAEEKLGLAQQKEEEARRQAGFKKNPLTGAYDVPLTYAEMSPLQQAKYDKDQSLTTLQGAKATEQEAKAVLDRYKADPNNVQNQAALARIQLEGKKVAIAGANLGLHQKQFLADYYGVDEKGEPIPGVEKTEEGKAVGVKVGKGGQPGQTLQTKGVQARNVQDNLNAAIDLIDQNPDLFGKVAGRYTSTRDMIGTNDPAIDRLGNLIHNAALASTSVHGLRGEKAVEATEKELLNHFRNSPEATVAGMQDTINSMGTFTSAAIHGAKKTIEAPTKKAAEAKTKAPAGATNEVFKDGKVIGHVVDGKFVALPK